MQDLAAYYFYLGFFYLITCILLMVLGLGKIQECKFFIFISNNLKTGKIDTILIYQSLGSILVLMNVLLGLLCLLNSFIIHFFSEKTPDELNKVNFIVNLLSRLSRIIMFLCKLLHPLKCLIGGACIYFIIFALNPSNLETKIEPSVAVVIKTQEDCVKYGNNEAEYNKTIYLLEIKSKGIYLSGFELISSVVVMVLFGIIRSLLEVNPLFHKPLDLESGKFGRCLFREVGP